jgi:hypothetical protein
MGDLVHYRPDIGIFTDNTRSALPITIEDLQHHSISIARSFKGPPNAITICVAVVEQGGTQKLVYTVSNNRTSPEIRAAADKIGATRWEQGPRANGRGTVGAPGDAEQILFEAADVNRFKVLAVAPSNHACKDCAMVLTRRGVIYTPPKTSGVTRPAPKNPPKLTRDKRTNNSQSPEDKKANTSPKKNPGKAEAKDMPKGEIGKSNTTNRQNNTSNTERSTNRELGKSSVDQDSRMTHNDGVSNQSPRFFKSDKWLYLLRRTKHTLKNIAPAVRKLFGYYAILDSVLSSFETIQNALHTFISGRHKSEAEINADLIRRTIIELQSSSNRLLDDVLGDEYFNLVDEYTMSTNRLDLLALSTFLNDIRRTAEELHKQLDRFIKDCSPQIKALEYVILKLTYFLETPTGAVLTVVIAEMQQSAYARMPILGTVLSVFGVMNFSVNTLAVMNLREICYHTRGPLIDAKQKAENALLLLGSVRDHIETLDSLLIQRLDYLNLSPVPGEESWAID